MGGQNSAQLQQMFQYMNSANQQQRQQVPQQNFNQQFMAQNAAANPPMQAQQQQPQSNQLPPQLQSSQMSGQSQQQFMHQMQQKQNTGQSMLPQNFGGPGQDAGAAQPNLANGASNNQNIQNKYESLIAQFQQQNAQQTLQQQPSANQNSQQFPGAQQAQQNNNTGSNAANDLYAQLFMNSKNMPAKNDPQFNPQNTPNVNMQMKNMIEQQNQSKPPAANMPSDTASLLQNFMNKQNQPGGIQQQAHPQQINQQFQQQQPQAPKVEEKQPDQNISNMFAQLQQQRQDETSASQRFQLPLAYQQTQKQPELQALESRFAGQQQNVNEMMRTMQQASQKPDAPAQNFNIGENKIGEMSQKVQPTENKEQISNQQNALAIALLQQHMQQDQQSKLNQSNQPAGQNPTTPYNLSQANTSQFLAAIANQYSSGNTQQQPPNQRQEIPAFNQQNPGTGLPSQANFPAEQQPEQPRPNAQQQFNQPPPASINQLVSQLHQPPTDQFQQSRVNPSLGPPMNPEQFPAQLPEQSNRQNNNQIDLVGQLNNTAASQDNLLQNTVQQANPSAPTASGPGQGGNVPKLMDYHNLSRMAEFCATKGDYEAAIDYYKRMTEILPENGPSWTALGHCYLLTEESHSAFNAYQHALYSLDDIKDPQLWYGIGILYEKFESYEHAISALIAVLKMSPNFYQKSEVLFKLGTIFAKTNQINEAITYFQNSIVASTFTIKRKIDTLLKVGLLYEVKQDYPAAQRSYEAALSLNEHNYRVFQHLAWCNFLKGNIQAALENLDKAERKLKGSTDTLYIYGRCMLELAKHREAHYYFHEAAHKAPNEAIFWASLAYYYYQEGKYKETFNNIIKATALKPELYEVWYNLGILYEKCKQPEEALIAYDRVLQIEKNQKDAQEHIAMIKSPNYEMRIAENQDLLSMKQPVYCLPNSLTILRKYQQINETESDIQKRIGITQDITNDTNRMTHNQQSTVNPVQQSNNGMNQAVFNQNANERIAMGQAANAMNNMQMPQNEVPKPPEQPIMQMGLKQQDHFQQNSQPQQHRIEQPPIQPSYASQFKDVKQMPFQQSQMQNPQAHQLQPPQQPAHIQPPSPQAPQPPVPEPKPVMEDRQQQFQTFQQKNQNQPQNNMMLGSKIMEPAHHNLGQVGNFQKQEESVSHQEKPQEQQEDNIKQVPYVQMALQMQNPNGHNIPLQHQMPTMLQQQPQQPKQNEAEQMVNMNNPAMIMNNNQNQDDQNTLTVNEDEEDQDDHQNQQNQNPGIISMRQIQNNIIPPPNQIVEPLPGHNQQQLGGLISSSTTTLPATIIQNNEQNNGKQNEVENKNVIVQKPPMFIENPSNVQMIQRPTIQLGYTNVPQVEQNAEEQREPQIMAPKDEPEAERKQESEQQFGGMKLVQNLQNIQQPDNNQQSNMPPIIMKSTTITMPLSNMQQPQNNDRQQYPSATNEKPLQDDQGIMPPALQVEPQEVVPQPPQNQDQQNEQVNNLNMNTQQNNLNMNALLDQIQNSGNGALIQQMLNQRLQTTPDVKPPQTFGLVQAPEQRQEIAQPMIPDDQKEQFQRYMNLFQQQQQQNNIQNQGWQGQNKEDDAQ